jgi:hypothetical protein
MSSRTQDGDLKAQRKLTRRLSISLQRQSTERWKRTQTHGEKSIKKIFGSDFSRKFAFLNSASSAFLMQGLYSAPPRSTVVKHSQGQLTQKMLLWNSSTNTAAKLRKDNLYIGVKLLSVVDINIEHEQFLVRLKILKNFRLRQETDHADTDYISVLKEAKCNGEQPLLLSTTQLQALKNSHHVPELKMKSMGHEMSSESVTIVFQRQSNSYFGLHAYELNVTVYSIMELEAYPFDMQNLGLKFVLEGMWKERYRICLHQLDVSCTRNGVNIAEDWEMCFPVVTVTSDYQTEVRLVVTRRWFHVVTQVVGITAVLTALAMISFVVLPENVGDRLTVVVTLTLTVVANKTNIQSQLPHVPYATCLDEVR